MFKTLSLISFCSFIGMALSAQPVLTSTSFYTPGDVVLAYDVDPSNLDDGGDGPDQVWDFGNIVPLHESTIWGGNVAAPASLNDFDYYDGANVAMVMGNGVVRYWKNDNNGLVAFGQGGNHDLLALEDASTLLEYPFTMGSACSDEASGTLYGTCYDFAWISSSETEGVGYGTLILPSGTYENVLKVRRVSFSNKINEQLGIVRENSIVEHFWFQAGTAGPLFYLRNWSNNGCPGSNQGNEAMYAIPNDFTTSVASNAAEQVAIGVFPNPARNAAQLNVRTNGELVAEIWISDLIGQRLANISEAHKLEGTQLYELNLAALQSGIYLVNVKTERAHYTQRLVVQ